MICSVLYTRGAPAWIGCTRGQAASVEDEEWVWYGLGMRVQDTGLWPAAIFWPEEGGHIQGDYIFQLCFVVFQVSEHLTDPMMTMITHLTYQRDQLFRLLRSKDKEISDLKSQGIQTSRSERNYVPSQFCKLYHFLERNYDLIFSQFCYSSLKSNLFSLTNILSVIFLISFVIIYAVVTME